MKHNVQKKTLSFQTSASYTHLRTPKDIWAELSKEFAFTLDACASDQNHLCEKYYTKENSCLDKDWTGEVVYCHPMFDTHIGRFVKKCHDYPGLSVMLLPAAVHTKYFHEYIYHNPRCEYRFLRKPRRGFEFGADDGIDRPLEPGKVGYIKPLMVVIFRPVEDK